MGIFYDEYGNIINSESILCDSFNEFFPKDIDEDGIFEISCVQYVSLNGHSDYIGDAETVIKFNSESKQFEVVKALFIHNTRGRFLGQSGDGSMIDSNTGVGSLS